MCDNDRPHAQRPKLYSNTQQQTLPTIRLLIDLCAIFDAGDLGNGALITPDVGGAAFGVVAGYYFWRWLRDPKWSLTIISGVAMGLAELSKSTWIVLFGAWPLVWLFWRVAIRHREFVPRASGCNEANQTSSTGPLQTMPPVRQLLLILMLGLYVLNCGYCFEDSLQSLGSFQFVSQSLGGKDAHLTPGNRFSNTLLGATPVPVPANYLHGIDVQRYDFERGKWSYLRGEVKSKGGWWYYYLYAMGVKIPTGTLILFGLLIVLKMARLAGLKQVANLEIRNERPSAAADLAARCTWLDEVVVLAPAVVVIVLVSSQTGFSRSLRYVLPAFPFLYIWISQIGQISWSAVSCRQERTRLGVCIGVVSTVALIASVTSSLRVLPHSLAYFNEIAGGPLNGPNHLLDANIDWDQDLLYVKEWYDAHPEARPFYLTRYGFIDPKIAGIDCQPVPRIPSEQIADLSLSTEKRIPSGYFAISVNELFGERSPQYAWIKQLKLLDRCGYSIQIYYAPVVTVHESDDNSRPKPPTH